MKNNWLDKYIPEAQNGIEGTMGGLTDKGFNYNGAWGGPSMQIGGSIPGSPGFTYARTQDAAPSNGKYAKKTLASAQNGQEMKFWQEGLDWKPKNISEDGTVIDPDGYWNSENWGKEVVIPSNQITMKGVDVPLLGISDTGDIQMMQPGQDYSFDGSSVTEIPMMQDGGRAEKINQALSKGTRAVGSFIGDIIAPFTPDYKSVEEREELFKRYRPIEYPGVVNSLRGILYPDEAADPGRDYKGNLNVGEEAWRKALDLPTKENYIVPSKYKPTTAKNPDEKYFTLKDVIDESKLIEEAKNLGWKPGAKYNVTSLAPFVKKGKSFSTEKQFSDIDPLQNFQISIDPKGEYVSIYDKYDFDFEPVNKVVKPFEIYDRFYLPKSTASSKKENGGWLSKYN